MRVRDFLQVVRNAGEISIGTTDGNAIRIDPDDPLIIAAYGDFKVKSIIGFPPVIKREKSVGLEAIDYEIALCYEPVKEAAQ